MRWAGETLHAAGVRAVYLVHGTFAGTDALGLIRATTWLLPDARQALYRRRKELADALLGEMGNYTPEYAALFEASLASNPSVRSPISVRRFHWSSENHHLGRADAAVRLLDGLNRLAEDGTSGRVLLWGHSHAGNVFAVLTNLLACDAETLEQFFTAARTFYRMPLFGMIDAPHWERAHDLLRQRRRPIDNLQLDMVTFGTPIRYGWDTAGCAKLLHFVNHRPAPDLPDYLAPFPPTPADIVHARHGDYLQQLAIAGTNMAPGFLEPRSWLADARLGRLVQSGIRRHDLWRNLAHGMRVPEEGTTLLVDYGDSDGGLARHLAGHGVYTRREWLLFHATEVCRRLYG